MGESMNKIYSVEELREAERLIAVVVLPTPPF